jgi:CHAT domain-containing protein/Tfp pilus assembly protein PilF
MLLFNQATAAHAGGDTGLALQLLEQAIEAAPADESGRRLFAVMQKAGWLRESGAHAEALALLDAVSHELQRLPVDGHETEWAAVRMEQGLHARDGGDFAAAERLLIEGEAFAEKSPARELQLPEMYANRASVYLEQGRFSDAQDLLLKALDVDQKLGNSRSESNDLNMLGLVYRGLGDDETARAYLTKAFEVAIESGLMHEAIEAMSNLGALMDDAGDHAGAAEIFRNIEKMSAEGADSASLACSVANQGVAAAAAGQSDEALRLFTRSHKLHLDAGNQLHAVQDQLNLSSLERRLGHPDRALPYAEQALAAAREYGLTQILWAAEYTVASCRRDLATSSTDEAAAMKQLEEALDGFRRAADVLELLRGSVDRPEERESLLSGKEVVYDDAIVLSLAMGRPRDAFQLSERARMRSFLDTLGRGRLERLEGGDPMADERRRLVDRLLDPSVSPDEKPRLMDELRRVRAQVIAQRPAVAAVTEAELPSEADIGGAIPTDAHVLEFFQVGDSIIQFLIGPDGLKDCRVIKFEEPVQHVVQRFRDEIDRSDPELPTGNMLFAALIRPMMSHLERCAKLIVVPHGSLHYVPLSALWFVPSGVDAPPRQYLRNRFSLTTAPSASYLPYLARTTADAPQLGPAIVLGNPTGDLEGAEIEAARVAAKLDVDPLVGPKATRSAVLDAGSPSVLHVASHGTYNPVDPLLSGLQLADGFVTVEDLLDAGPAPGLLVLSGCVTGLSLRRPGDELVGLAQAALRRGTRSVVATLWETFDESSALFFDHFYNALLSGSTTSEALGWARDALGRDPGGFDQPIDWAPFLLIGDPDTRVADPKELPSVDFDRGLELAKQGDRVGAKAAYKSGIENGSPKEAAFAAFALGMLLEEEGDLQGASRVFRHVIDTGEPKIAPMAMNALARLIEDQDVEAAKDLYRHAIDSRHIEASPNAALDLGFLLVQDGDTTGAQAAYEYAMNSANPEASAKGAYSLGGLLGSAGDVEGARAAYRRAIASGVEDVARAAALNLQALERGTRPMA